MSATTRVVIRGQGDVGLPVAVRAADVGFHVVGFDIDKRRVDSLARVESFVEDVPDDELKHHLGSGRYAPSIDVNDLVWC